MENLIAESRKLVPLTGDGLRAYRPPANEPFLHQPLQRRLELISRPILEAILEFGALPRTFYEDPEDAPIEGSVFTTYQAGSLLDCPWLGRINREGLRQLVYANVGRG